LLINHGLSVLSSEPYFDCYWSFLLFDENFLDSLESFLPANRAERYFRDFIQRVQHQEKLAEILSPDVPFQIVTAFPLFQQNKRVFISRIPVKTNTQAPFFVPGRPYYQADHAQLSIPLLMGSSHLVGSDNHSSNIHSKKRAKYMKCTWIFFYHAPGEQDRYNQQDLIE